MAVRKTFPLRMDPAVFEALQRWADEELRSLNGQIEYVLRDALRRRGRAAGNDPPPPSGAPDDEA
ncbi:MAG: Arc family DNA binding domain-containing protein [Ardenticatenales bacterium]